MASDCEGDATLLLKPSTCSKNIDPVEQCYVEQDMKGNFQFNPEHTASTGKLLLSVLTKQACSSFGEGLLAHLLLRGSEKQKRACALSLPYLCR